MPKQARLLGHALRALAVVGLLVGCEQSGMSDLREYIKEVKARPPGRIEPLPEIEAVEGFVFDPRDRRDPFVMDRQTTEITSDGASLAPDPNRPKEQLEQFPLTDLNMVGTLQQENGALWALVRTKTGQLYRVQVGNYVGQNNGQIVAIKPDVMRIVEIVLEASGEWRENEQVIPLTKP
ncbi:pilus assembly protein PilP [Thiocapsa imhoffii]|uniref:Pilus assembly protein PilP n=1 Tax=Thiocapsa imhoffii TaxID=382777 RepID=A0A9X0WI71_9GAMM|nr:pilus assembly protein PilP [Thiocapsa imhoffii]MBK1644981.1 pilus assembly protein PilP [Thiocapsa imhoffii]